MCFGPLLPLQHHPSAGWKVPDSGPRGRPQRGRAASPGLGQDPRRNATALLSAALLWAAQSITCSVRIHSPRQMADFPKTSQQWPSLWFKMTPSQLNDTDEEDQRKQGQVSSARTYCAVGKLVTRGHMGSDRAQRGQCSQSL